MPKLDLRQIEQGNRTGYSDMDMLFTPDGYFRKNGMRYHTDRIP